MNENEGKRKQGTGLGLAIVKTILENHGFEYGVESEIGKGTTIRITLKRRFD